MAAAPLGLYATLEAMVPDAAGQAPALDDPRLLPGSQHGTGHSAVVHLVGGSHDPPGQWAIIAQDWQGRLPENRMKVLLWPLAHHYQLPGLAYDVGGLDLPRHQGGCGLHVHVPLGVLDEDGLRCAHGQ
ncbi:MAG: hypothetical protein AN484_25935 [Aphanizomenon flos-aquae WA102]|uniref:Uncharacterized protein n=1 Tax=Aphanizomenon flos-aquae WA102 TaxID=1710896 RepID=A0A1B7WFZ0_APHFL|nr:MAG: hypothetical protein AN484_25935 [Aphanizomenon flos-aquae WA102]